MQEFIKTLVFDFLSIPGINQLGYEVTSESWINQNGIGLGEVSCLSRPADDAIELTIDIKVKENLLIIDMGVYWSNGVAIKEISNIQIDGKEVSNKFASFLEAHRDEAIKTLRDALIEHHSG